MIHVLVVGGGLAGCTAALELADKGIRVTIVEKAKRIGGKVRNYGCKATDRCNNCGLCLTGALWEKVENHGRIKIITGSNLVDIYGKKGNFDVLLLNEDRLQTLTKISSIIISVGFDRFSTLSFGNLETCDSDNIISSYRLEEILSQRSKDAIFPVKPSSIAFIQCFGSRDIKEKAMYCSRVCCGYSTMAARVIKQYYPEARVVFFYMDLQEVEAGEYFKTLGDEGIEFIRCRPVNTVPGNPAGIIYEDPKTGRVMESKFDIVVLSEGIHPPGDVNKIAEACTLGIDGNGFLKLVESSGETGIYLAGCASGPKGISETYTEALTAARSIQADIRR